MVSGGKTTDQFLVLAAPPAGDWSVLVNWESGCAGPEIGSIDDLFRVVVKASPLDVPLNAPGPGSGIVQNDPATGCPAHATAGYGLAVDFAWTAPTLDGRWQYELLVQHVNSLNPALFVRVDEPSYTWLSCNSFVVDRNLADWFWQVTAVYSDAEITAVSERRAISFLPCRLADGSACSSP